MSLVALPRVYFNNRPCTATVEGSQIVLDLRGDVEVVLPIRDLEVRHIRRLPGRGDAIELAHRGNEIILIVPFRLRGLVHAHLGIHVAEPTRAQRLATV